jgi:hypothetical protein
MAEARLGKALAHMRRGREGRVHQHDRRADLRIEPIVDLLGVVPGDRGRVAKQPAEQPGAGLGDLVEKKPRPGELGKDRQQPGSGRWFEQQIGGGQRRRRGGDKAECQRCRELLQPRGFFRAARLRRQPRGKARQHLEHGRSRAGAGAHRRPEFAQEHHLGCFERLVGVLPHPGTLGVGGGKRRLHRRAQCAGIERAVLAEPLRQQGGGMEEARGLVGRGLRQKQRERGRGRRRSLGGIRHARDLRESGRGTTRESALFPRPGSHPPLTALSLLRLAPGPPGGPAPRFD